MIGLYIHVPFCVKRCSYCDFYSTTGLQAKIPEYVKAISRELGCVTSHRALPPVGSVYFGGGTPSTLPPEQIEIIMARIYEELTLLPGTEITIEANPGSVTKGTFAKYRQMGINRLSLGVQSIHKEELKLFGRIHTHPQTIETYRWAREEGFDNISLDLIFGAPRQSRVMFQESLDQILALHPEHLALYAFSLEEGTPFAEWIAEGSLPAPDDDLAADMYEDACIAMMNADYEHYEISNWAKPGYQARHNTHYWRSGEYIGLGPSAHGYLWGQRYWNVLTLQAYFDRMVDPDNCGQFPALDGFEVIDEKEAISEAMILGLRLLIDGVDEQAFTQRFGKSPFNIFSSEIEGLTRRGLLQYDGNRLTLTPEAYLIGNQVFYQFL